MYTHLLVPLDGSPLAEAALPVAAALAAEVGAAVTLLHVIEDRPPGTVHGSPHLSSLSDASGYLNAMARHWFDPRTPLTAHVHTESHPGVAAGIVEHADELGADLIVLCTHGRGGLRHRLFGSIAQQVVQTGHVPVLLVPPSPAPDASSPGFVCRRLLVPLDGQPDHEEGIRAALHLAHACDAALDLLVVVPTYGTLSGPAAATGTLLPRTTSALLDIEEARASRYVHAKERELERTGTSVATGVVRGDPATVIVDRARERHADAIVLGTHGKRGMDAFWAGSVAPRVSQLSRVPLLLVGIHPAADDD